MKKIEQCQQETHRCVNNSLDIKILMKVIKTETFNVGFISQ